MIVGKMADLAKYVGCHPGLDAAIQYALSLDFDQLPDGSDPGDGQYFHMNVFHTDISGNPNWEMHRRYIDLQIILEGEETIAWLPLSSLEEFTPYDEERDIQFSADPKEGALCQLNAGMFGIYFPEDAHRPGIGSGSIRKVVLKVLVDPPQLREAESPFNHLGTARLETNRLLLREYTMDDAGVMFLNWASDPEVAKTLMWNPHPDVDFTRKLLAQWIQAYQSGRSYHWVVEKDGEVIGDISLMTWSNRTQDGEIGYCLSKKAWNQGIMTEALMAVMRFLFAEVGFRRLTLRHATNNPASGRVMEKAGLRFEGVQRQAYPEKEGGFSDLALYAALKEEWLAENPA